MVLPFPLKIIFSNEHHPKILGSRKEVSYPEFKRRYGGKAGHVDPDLLEELSRLLHLFMIRRQKHEVLDELGEKQRRPIFARQADLDQEQLRLLNTTEKDSEEEEGILSGRIKKPSSTYMQRFRLTGLAKTRAVGTFLDQNPGRKMLIFHHHTDVGERIRDIVAERLKPGERQVRISGSTSAADRKAAVEDFQNSESVRFAVLSIRAAGVGITMTAASVVLFAELYWGPEYLRQVSIGVVPRSQLVRVIARVDPP